MSTWIRVKPQYEENAASYRVTAVRQATGAYTFVAWGPDQRPAAWNYRDYSNGHARHWHPAGGLAHYAIGQPIPQARELLGVYPTAIAARARCDDHARTLTQTAGERAQAEVEARARYVSPDATPVASPFAASDATPDPTSPDARTAP